MKKQNLKYGILVGLGFLLTLFSFLLSVTTYVGVLTLIPILFALLFLLFSLRVGGIEKIHKKITYGLLMLTLLVSLIYLFSEITTKPDKKVDFIENFSDEIEDNLNTNKDSLN
jgi:energy-coupling factor transporter transmembrane protein EcfT